MSPLTVLAISLGALAAAFVLFVALPKALLIGFRDSLDQRIKHRYPDSSVIAFVDYTANSFGVESRGALQWRGNGALVLSDKDLRFFQIMVEEDLVISLERITRMALVHKHLGKATPSKLLRVEFRGRQRPDAVAFWVPDPQALKALIESRLPATPPAGAS